MRLVIIPALIAMLASGAAWGQLSICGNGTWKDGQCVTWVPKEAAQIMMEIKQMPRAYTLDEIDRMRAAERKILTKGLQYCYDSIGGGRYRVAAPGSVLMTYDQGIPASEIDRQVEDRVRTYMAGGVSPEEVEAKAEKP